MAPAEVWPSPQSMVAVNWSRLAPARVERKQAGMPVKATPGSGAIGLGVRSIEDSPSSGSTLVPALFDQT